jgi:hypothetical protein
VGEVLFLSMMSILSGADGFYEMSQWMKIRKGAIVKFLGKAFKVPAYTTIRNVFLNIDSKEVNKLFEKWSCKLNDKNNNFDKFINIVASDGKTMRGSKDRIKDINAKHIVSLFQTQNKITLAQTQVDDKSNEIPALLELLESLKLTNCVITVDALHTQINTLETIVKKNTIL